MTLSLSTIIFWGPKGGDWRGKQEAMSNPPKLEFSPLRQAPTVCHSQGKIYFARESTILTASGSPRHKYSMQPLTSNVKGNPPIHIRWLGIQFWSEASRR